MARSRVQLSEDAVDPANAIALTREPERADPSGARWWRRADAWGVRPHLGTRVSRSTIAPELLAACRRGDRAAMRALHDAYADRVYSIALHFSGGDEAAAQDVASQVFVTVLTKLSGFREDAELSTWLYRIVVNACLDERRRLRRLVALDAPSETPARAASPPSPHDEALRAESGRRVRAALARLSPKLRLVLLLKYFEDLSYEEMARVLDCSAGTVASRLNRAHRALARLLAPDQAADRSTEAEP